MGAAVAALQGGLGQPRPGPSPVWLSSVHWFQRREGGEGKRRKKRGREPRGGVGEEGARGEGGGGGVPRRWRSRGRVRR